MRFGSGLLIAMAAGTYLVRLLGFALARRGVNESLTRLIPLFPAALLSGLVVMNVFARDGRIVLDERVAGLAVAIYLAWRGRGIATIVGGGIAATALVRLALRTFAG